MQNLFGNTNGGLDLSSIRIEPNVKSLLEADYWEEFSDINLTDAIGLTPNIKISRNNKVADSNCENNGNNDAVEHNGNEKPKDVPDSDRNSWKEPELPYCFCFCCRTGTPFIVWIFIGISLLFFNMGAIVTGRWISISQSSWDEIVFYAAFSVCLGFATYYYRHGTKHHNPFDILFLVLTVPIMWGLLGFTTIFFKQDIFFSIGAIIYTIFAVPYVLIGAYMTYKFWKFSKLFIRRVSGNKELELHCRKYFFILNYLTFDTQITICACVISMAPSANHTDTRIWLSSVILGPVFLVSTIVWFLLGQISIRKGNKISTIIFTIFSVHQLILIVSVILKRPRATDALAVFTNVGMIGSSILLLLVHFSFVGLLWKWIVPNYGTGLRKALKRTNRNSCIQFAEISICR